MNLSITDPISAVITLAILMLGYANRRAVTTGVVRTFAKDHSKGHLHRDQAKQLLILRKRLDLLSSMAIAAALGAIFALASAICLLYGRSTAAKITFVIAFALGIVSLLQAARESFLSNKSIFIELDSTVSAEDPYYQGGAP